MRPLVPTLIVLAVFSGCVAGPTPDPDSEPLFTEDLGAVEGKVVDELLAPVAEALVIVEAAGEARTDMTGSFAVGRLPPGEYEVRVEAEGFETATKTITVVAGEVSEAGFTLIALPGTDAYHETFHNAGFIACSTSAAVAERRLFVFAACGVFQILGQNQLDEFLSDWNEYGLAPDVPGLWGETTWESNQALSDRLRVTWFTRDDPRELGETSAATVKASSGPSPVRVPITIEELVETEFGDEKVCEDFECPLISGHYAEADNTKVAPHVVIVFQQRYEDFLTVFHGPVFPMDFTALPDQ